MVGYNKNVAEYTRHALRALAQREAAAQPPPLVTLEHCNAFLPGKEHPPGHSAASLIPWCVVAGCARPWCVG